MVNPCWRRPPGYLMYLKYGPTFAVRTGCPTKICWNEVVRGCTCVSGIPTQAERYLNMSSPLPPPPTSHRSTYNSRDVCATCISPLVYPCLALGWRHQIKSPNLRTDPRFVFSVCVTISSSSSLTLLLSCSDRHPGQLTMPQLFSRSYAKTYSHDKYW